MVGGWWGWNSSDEIPSIYVTFQRDYVLLCCVLTSCELCRSTLARIDNIHVWQLEAIRGTLKSELRTMCEWVGTFEYACSSNIKGFSVTHMFGTRFIFCCIAGGRVIFETVFKQICPTHPHRIDVYEGCVRCYFISRFEVVSNF